MTLYDVWNPIRNNIAGEIKLAYDKTTNDTLSSVEAVKIENMLFNYCHALMQCNMSFYDETTLSELQSLVKQVVNHKAFVLVAEWKMICDAVGLDTGKDIHQESFYDVADTPRIESKDFNDLNIKIRKVQALYQNSQAIKDFYNEIKLLVQTIY